MRTKNSQPTLGTVCRGLLLVALTVSAQCATPLFQWSTVAGRASIGSEDGPAATARFNHPSGLAVDLAGNLYVADSGNHTIRKISPAGAVSTVAGSPGQPGSADGMGATARFNGPQGVAVDAAGNLYVADTGNFTIRLITPAGLVTTLAGQAGRQGTTDGNAASALFFYPQSVTVDTAGNVDVADSGYRRISAGTVQTIAPTVTTVILADGSSATATFHRTTQAVNANGPVYFGGQLQAGPAATLVSALFKLDGSGLVTVLYAPLPGYDGFLVSGGAHTLTQWAADPAGNLVAIFYNGLPGGANQVGRMTAGGIWQAAGFVYDGTGADCAAYGLTASPTGGMFFSRGDNVIVKLAADGTKMVLTGTPRGYFAGIDAVALDSAGNVWAGAIEDQSPGGRPGSAPVLLKVSPDGTVAIPFRPGVQAEVNVDLVPWVAADGSDNIYFTDTRSTSTLDRISPTGAITSSSLSLPAYNFVADSTGDLIIPDLINHVMWKRTPADGWSVLAGKAGLAGTDDGTGENARFGNVGAITADRSGNFYVLDTKVTRGLLEQCVIRRITPGGVVSTVSGNLLLPPSLTEFLPEVEIPAGLAIDSHGVFYLAYRYNCMIWRLTPQGEAAVIGGAGLQAGSADGLGPAARFMGPGTIAVDAHDELYVADNVTIRHAQLAGPPTITVQPQGQAVIAGGSVEFTVTAVGVPAPAYQWYFDGSPFNGATTNTLSVTSARTSDAGDYTVDVTNELGTVTSNKATLTITPAPAPMPAPSSGGGGGGAPSGWFALALFALGAARVLIAPRKWLHGSIKSSKAVS